MKYKLTTQFNFLNVYFSKKEFNTGKTPCKHRKRNELKSLSKKTIFSKIHNFIINCIHKIIWAWSCKNGTVKNKKLKIKNKIMAAVARSPILIWVYQSTKFCVAREPRQVYQYFPNCLGFWIQKCISWKLK